MTPNFKKPVGSTIVLSLYSNNSNDIYQRLPYG